MSRSGQKKSEAKVLKGRVEGKKGDAGEESICDPEVASVQWQGVEERGGTERWSLPGDDSAQCWAEVGKGIVMTWLDSEDRQGRVRGVLNCGESQTET